MKKLEDSRDPESNSQEPPQEGHIKAFSLTVEQLDTIDINPELPQEQRQQVKELVWLYQDVFANSLNEIATTDLVEHKINLKPGARPYYCPGLKRFPPQELKFIKEELERELSANKIIKYDRPWCAPITIAKKKNRDFCKCITYNGLNN